MALACDGGGEPGEIPAARPGALVPADGGEPPLIGTSYTHLRFDGCAVADGRGILATLHEGEAVDTLRTQLARMRAAGIGSLRLVVWHMRDVPRQRWGVVPSRGGRLPEPFRGNLVALLGGIREAGFRRLTVSFSPQWANSPLRDEWDSGRFEENWSFLRDVRALALEHGPPELRFDLLNEGAPSAHAPAEQRRRMEAYLARIWRRYADAWGVADATVSVIGATRPEDRGRRLEHLLDAVEGAGGPPPRWIELHLNAGAPGVRLGLRRADSVLAARGLDAPLTVGETAYDDGDVADVFAEFIRHSDRPLAEVIQWFLPAGSGCVVSPPYQAEAYVRLARDSLGTAGGVP